MKNFKIIIPIFLFTLLIMSSRLEASCQIVTPANGQNYDAPSNQTTISITFTSDCVYDPSTIPYVCWYIDDVLQNPHHPGMGASTSITRDVSVGNHTVRAELYQYTGILGFPAGEDTHTFSVLSHGNCTSSAAQVGPGETIDSKTSIYISPGSNVAYTLRLMGYANTTGVFASAELVGIVSISKNIQHSDGYYNYQTNGTLSNFAGGTITLRTDARVTPGYSGNASATATITW